MQENFEINKKIRTLRDSLKLGRGEFAEKTDIPKKTIENLEQEKQKAYAWHIQAICNVWPEYTLWLMTNQIAPEIGQISPELEETRRQLEKAG